MAERLRETSIEFDVPFRHIDIMGVVWHGHYYGYMEDARTKLIRECGLDSGDLLGSRYFLYVIESKCRYVNPLLMGNRVRVTAWLRDVKRRIHIAYEIHNLTRGCRAARGHTMLATTDHERNLLLETPDAIQRRLLG